jgi:hypothetical protein
LIQFFVASASSFDTTNIDDDDDEDEEDGNDANEYPIECQSHRIDRMDT